MTTASVEPRNWAVLGIACSLPAVGIWLWLFVDQLSSMLSSVLVVGLLLALPLAGGILGALGLRRHKVLGALAMLLGLGLAGLMLLFQLAP